MVIDTSWSLSECRKFIRALFVNRPKSTVNIYAPILFNWVLPAIESRMDLNDIEAAVQARYSEVRRTDFKNHNAFMRECSAWYCILELVMTMKQVAAKA